MNKEIIKQSLKELENCHLTDTNTKKVSAEEEQKISNYLRNVKCEYKTEPESWSYCCRLFYSLLKIIEHVNLDSVDIENILHPEELNLILKSILNCCQYGLEILVQRQSDRITFSLSNQSDDDYQKLVNCLRIFHKFFGVKFISSNFTFDDAKLDYFVGVLSVISIRKNQTDSEEFREYLTKVGNFLPPEVQFKYLMMSKGFKGLGKEFQLLVHQELMRRIRSKNGIYILCRSLLVKSEAPNWQKFSIIAKIIESSMTKSSQEFMVSEVFRTLDAAIISSDSDIIGACVYIIKNLETKEDLILKKLVYENIFSGLDGLAQPEVMLCGSIVRESNEISATISRLCSLFSSSEVTSLPSAILNTQFYILFDLFGTLSDGEEEMKNRLRSVLVYFMINRSKTELEEIVRNMRLKDDASIHVVRIHSRICMKNGSIQIGPEQIGLKDDTETFLDLIKNSNNNFLIFDVFNTLIKIFASIQNSDDKFLSGYDVDEENLPEVLHKKFFKKLAILEPLQEMIQWKSLQTQLSEKSQEILTSIKEILLKSVGSSSSLEEQIFVIFLAIFRELSTQITDENQKSKIKVDIKLLKEKCKSPKLFAQIEMMFSEENQSKNLDPQNLKFNDAMELMNSTEIYVKVYGIDTLVKLIRRRDQKSLTSRHIILATALQHLKERESYAFLNIIRLLVELSYHMESEVVDSLISEYKNKELEIDERLKFGEVIVKVIENLGPMAMKFKQQLIQCFLNGSRDVNHEFRSSSLVNLGNICRILCYQIHSFFYEMFEQIEGIIQNDDYLPSKRAAAMVLSQILSNLPNLMDFQDFLLPIYHLLKHILAYDDDPQTRIHAEIAMDHLNSKTKDFLHPQLKPEKEIKIRLEENPNEIREIKFKY